jgi:hypothetical protein
MPIIAVWVNGMLFFTAGQGTRKARNLVLNAHCVISVEQEPLDLVIEGSARKTRDDETLRRVAERYATIYDWHVTVRDGLSRDGGRADGRSTSLRCVRGDPEDRLRPAGRRVVRSDSMALRRVMNAVARRRVGRDTGRMGTGS